MCRVTPTVCFWRFTCLSRLQFSHVSHVHLQWLSVMSVMSACVQPFQFFSFHLFPKEYFLSVFFRKLLLEILLGEVFPFNTLLKGDLLGQSKKSLFSLRFNNMWHFAHLSGSIYVSSRYTMDQWRGES